MVLKRREGRGRRQRMSREHRRSGERAGDGEGVSGPRPSTVQVSATDLSLPILQCLAAPQTWRDCVDRALEWSFSPWVGCPASLLKETLDSWGGE